MFFCATANNNNFFYTFLGKIETDCEIITLGFTVFTNRVFVKVSRSFVE